MVKILIMYNLIQTYLPNANETVIIDTYEVNLSRRSEGSSNMCPFIKHMVGTAAQDKTQIQNNI